MTRRFVYRFRFIMFAWLACRWPHNPFLFFFDMACLLIDLMCLGLLPAAARLHIMSAYVVRLDCRRLDGALPEPPPWADRALRQALERVER